MKHAQWIQLKQFIQDCPAEVLWHSPLRMFAEAVIRRDKYIIRLGEYNAALQLRKDIISSIDRKMNIKVYEVQDDINLTKASFCWRCIHCRRRRNRSDRDKSDEAAHGSDQSSDGNRDRGFLLSGDRGES